MNAQKEKSHDRSPGMVQTSIAIPKTLLDAVSEIAYEQERSRNKVITMLLREKVAEYNAKKKRSPQMAEQKSVNAGSRVFWTVVALVCAILFFHDLDEQSDSRIRAMYGEDDREPLSVVAAYDHGLVSSHVGWIQCVIGLGILYSIGRLRKEFSDFYKRVDPMNQEPPPLP